MAIKTRKEETNILEIVSFIKQKNYKGIKKLGNGSFGITVLLEDETIDEKFVCKKYLPQTNINKEKYYKNFLNEIKLMYRLNHNNIVRVFNYYMYEESYTGFVLMEYIKGSNINQYLKKQPEMLNDIFEQTIDGFSYLESKKILHRDIRPTNILVDESGFVKIIDFGFGKEVFNETDFNRSFSSLNWWCALPADFQNKTYDFKTEVYFVGKLFEKIIIDNDINGFAYNDVLSRMCVVNPNERIKSFDIVKRDLQINENLDELFNENEIEIYQRFATGLSEIITSVYEDVKYYDDVDIIQKELSNLYKIVMLENVVPHNPLIIRCFINGAYRYKLNKHFSTKTLKEFLNFIKRCTKDKKNIVINNLHSRFDSIRREVEELIGEDEIPF